MTVKAIFGDFSIHGLDLKNIDELVQLLNQVQNAVDEVLKGVRTPESRGRLSGDFELDVEKKAGVFDD